VRGEIGVGVSGCGGGSMGEIPVFETGENKRRDNVSTNNHQFGNVPPTWGNTFF
jgi:hypothetical protein